MTQTQYIILGTIFLIQTLFVLYGYGKKEESMMWRSFSFMVNSLLMFIIISVIMKMNKMDNQNICPQYKQVIIDKFQKIITVKDTVYIPLK